jgi:hypothetical protein
MIQAEWIEQFGSAGQTEAPAMNVPRSVLGRELILSGDQEVRRHTAANTSFKEEAPRIEVVIQRDRVRGVEGKLRRIVIAR